MIYLDVFKSPKSTSYMLVKGNKIKYHKKIDQILHIATILSG